ncbi:MAG: xanthine dehydrogenase family protein subunit M [Eubacteriales bacterium]|nr:xanthine dehydrogenase family protein subunit M [Eubacteriales bacterium]
MSVKTMKPFEYHAPLSIKELLGLLDEYQEKAVIIAGGTDVVPKLKGRVLAPDHVVDISGIKELSYLKYDEEDGLRIGSALTLKQLEASEIVRDNYPALYQGSSSIASTQIRNVATIVGNICNAVPSADSAPSLLVLGAKVRILSSEGERLIPIEEFFTGVCRTVLKRNEVVTELQIPAPAQGYKSVYYSHTARRALDLAMVGVAVGGIVEAGVCKEVKIGLGAVAITPKRAYEAEKLLIGKQLTKELIEEAAECACMNDCAPITDMRATSEYRREMVRVLTRNGLCEIAGL